MTGVRLTAAQIDALRPLLQPAGGPRFVLIGAAALSAHVSLDRMTNDLDLVFVASPREYERWFESQGWQRSRFMSHRWRLGDVYLDALPITPEIVLAGQVSFEGGVVMSEHGRFRPHPRARTEDAD